MALTLLPSIPTFSEGSQIIPAVNAALSLINASVDIVVPSSTINILQVTGGISGSPVVVTIAGPASETNVDLGIAAKGTGDLFLGGLIKVAAELVITPNPTGVNQFNITGGASSSGAVLSTAGSNTDIDMILNPKGSGLLRFNNLVSFTAIGAGAATLTNVAPAGLASSTVSKWLTVKDSAGGLFFIPTFH